MHVPLQKLVALCFAGASMVGCDLDLKASRKALSPELQSQIAVATSKANASPNDGPARASLGELYLSGGAYFEAADAFKEAARLGDETAPVHAGLAASYLALGYIRSCIEHLTACFKADRNNPDCMLTLATLMEGDGRPEALGEARRAYQQFLLVAPNHPRAPYVQSMLEQLNARLGPEDAKKDTNQTGTSNDSAEQPEGQGEAKAPGSETTGRASSDGPQASEASSTSAGTGGVSGDAKSRVPGHGSGVGANSAPVGELTPFGKAMKQAFDARDQNDLNGAESAYREALKLQTDDPGALAGLGEILWLKHDAEKAVDAVSRAYRLDPRDPEVRYAYGLVMIRSGRDTKTGLAAWRAIIADDPEFAKSVDLEKTVQNIDRFTSAKNIHPDMGTSAQKPGRAPAKSTPSPH